MYWRMSSIELYHRVSETLGDTHSGNTGSIEMGVLCRVSIENVTDFSNLEMHTARRSARAKTRVILWFSLYGFFFLVFLFRFPL